MGQGAEDAGGYEVDYDPYEESDGSYWIQRDGSQILISAMTPGHLRAALRIVEAQAASANFTGDAESWQEWVEIFERELSMRGDDKPLAVYTSPEAVKPTRGSKVEMVCNCGNDYSARKADLKRGYGYSCSKRCASVRREYGRHAAKRKITQAH